MFGNRVGFSLVNALVGMALMGLLAVGVNRLLIIGAKGQKSITINGNREAIRRMVLGSIACKASLPTGTCIPGESLDIYRRVSNGPPSVFISKTTGGKFGSWTAKAECADSGAGFFVKVARLKPTGTINSTQLSDFKPDPLWKKKVKWSDPASNLFPANTEICTEGIKYFVQKSVGDPDHLKEIRDNGAGNADVLIAHLNDYQDTASISIGDFTYTPVGDLLRITSKVYLRVRGRSREARIRLNVSDTNGEVFNNPLHHQVAATDNHDSNYHNTVGDELLTVTPGNELTFKFYLVGFETAGEDSKTVDGYVPLVGNKSPIKVILHDSY